MTDKFYVLNYRIIFYTPRKDSLLKNVEYTIVFYPEGKGRKKQTYTGTTDSTGQTDIIKFTENGKLHVFVKGYPTIKSEKKIVMKPLLMEGDSVFPIDDDILKRNKHFITEKEYEAELCRSPKNNKDVKYELSYEKYKQNNTVFFDKKHKLIFKSYIQYQFIDSCFKSVPIIQYQIFEESREEPLVGPRPKSVDIKGLTDIAETYKSTFVKYRLGKKNSEKSTYFEPITCVDEQTIYPITIPMKTGITNQSLDHCVSVEKVGTSRVVISPHDNEVILLDPDAYDEFDRQTQILSDIIKKVHKSNNELRKAIQHRNADEIEELEKRLGLSQELALKKINGEFDKREKLKEVWVFEKKGKSHEYNSEKALHVRYLNADKYQHFYGKKLNKASKVDMTGPNMSKYTPQKIKEGFEHLGHELMSESGSIGSEEKQIFDLMGGLGGEVAKEYINAADLNVSEEAQWLRLVTGAYADGLMHVGDKGVAIRAQGSASAKAVLFEGVKEWRKFFPCESGWTLEFNNCDLGTIRFLVGAELSGFAGANLAIAGNISVDIYDDDEKTQRVNIAKHKPEKSMAKNLGKHGKPTITMAEGNLQKIEANKQDATNQANLGVNAFVGATGQCLLQGAIEWFKPSEDPKKNGEGKFVTIASVVTGGGVSIGVGAEGAFQMGYDDKTGNFKILIAAHYCWAVGAKGVVGFTVGTEHLADYISFIKLKLLQIGFRTLVYMQAGAFRMLSQVLAYCIGNNAPLTQSVIKLADEYDGWIDKLDKDQERLRSAERINSAAGRRELIDAPPESKGILLYVVTHWSHSTAGIFDSNFFKPDANQMTNGGLETFVTRKRAVITILKTCLTRAEWQNTIQHIHPQGKKLTCEQLGKVEGDLIRFLNHRHHDTAVQQVINGININENYTGEELDNDFLREYCKYRAQAKAVTEPSCHYMLVSSQDDIRYKQMVAQQGILQSESPLQASNLHTLAAFESSQTTKTDQA